MRWAGGDVGKAGRALQASFGKAAINTWRARAALAVDVPQRHVDAGERRDG